MTLSPGGRPADASPVGTPGGRQNWVDKAGGLPKYVRMVAHALMRKGMPEGKAIPAAVNRIKRWAAGMDNVRPQVQAAAKAALAEWEAKKGMALSSSPHIDAAMILDLAAPDEWVAELVATYAASEALDLAARDYVRDPVGRFATTGRADSQGPRAGFGKAGEQREDAGKPAVDRFGPDHKYQLDSLAAIRDLMRQWRRVPFSQRNALKARMTSKAKALGGSTRLLTLIGGLGDSDGKAEKGEGAAAAIRTGNVKEWLARQGLHLSADEDADELLDLAAGTLEALEGDTIDLAPGDYHPPYDWKHGFIPLTPAAAASKAKKGPHVGQGSTRRPNARAVGKAMQAAQARQKSKAAKVAGKPRVTPAEAAKNADDHARGRGVPGAPTVPTTAGPSAAEKIRNAETMHGTGSKQHLEAIRRFGDTPAPAKKTTPAKKSTPSPSPKVDQEHAAANAAAVDKAYAGHTMNPDALEAVKKASLDKLNRGEDASVFKHGQRNVVKPSQGERKLDTSADDHQSAADAARAAAVSSESKRTKGPRNLTAAEKRAHAQKREADAHEAANMSLEQLRAQQDQLHREGRIYAKVSDAELLDHQNKIRKELGLPERKPDNVVSLDSRRPAGDKYAGRRDLEQRARAAGYDGNLNGDGSDQLQAFLDAKANGHPIPVGRAVNARQPGIEKVTTGRLEGYDANGMMKVKPHDGGPVGTFNPSHVAEAGKPLRNTPDSRTSGGAPSTTTPAPRRDRNAEAQSFVRDNAGEHFQLKSANGTWTPKRVNRGGQGEYVTWESTTHPGVTVDKFPDEATKLDATGFPDNGPKKPGDMTQRELVDEQTRLGNYLRGNAGGTATPADKARWQQRHDELQAEWLKRRRDHMLAGKDRTDRAQQARDKAAGTEPIPNRSDAAASDRRAQDRAIERKDYANADGPALANAAADRGLIGRERAMQKSDAELRTMLRNDDAAKASRDSAEAVRAKYDPATAVDRFAPQRQAMLDRKAQGADAPAAPSSDTTSTNPDASMRVEHTPDGTLVHGTERGDTEANAALKAQGFKWSRNLNAWYLPRTWNESTRDQRVKNLERTLGDKLGVDRTTGPRMSAAEREAQKRERAAGRAEHMDAKAQKLGAEASRRFEASDLREEKSGIPFGQPILVGHHSERRHRAAIERAHANLGKGVEAQKAADDAAAAAERARRTAAGNESKMTIGNRIQKNERELRDLDRRLNGTHSSMGGRKPEGDYRTRLENMRADVADQLDHDRGKLAAAGGVPSKDTVSPGDFVKIRGQWYPVKKSNAKTVGVPNTMIPGRNSTSPWHEVSEHKKADEVTRADVARMIQQNSAAFPHLKTELAKAAPEKDPTADAPSGGVLNMPAPTSSPEVQRAAVKRPADHGSASDPMTKPVRDLTDAQLEQAANYERQRATMRGMPEPTRAKARARHAEVLNEMNRREAERKPATVTPLDPSRGITPETAGRMSDSQLEDAMSRLMQSGTYSGPAFDVLQREMDKRDARRAEGNRPRR